MNRWERLPWDSEFFDLGIGRIDLDGADRESIAVAEDEARREGVVCLYGSLDPLAAEDTVKVQRAGYRFVEAATTFSLSPKEPSIPRPEGINVRPGDPGDLPHIADIVDKLAPWSRFAVDPRFGHEAAIRMQRAWIERAARPGDDEFSFVVAEDDTGIIAFITRVDRADRGEPTVDAVGTSSRGSGAARYLIEEARAWAGDRPLLGGPAAARNVNVLRYVGHCGFRVSKVRYLYHRWLDEDANS